MAIYPDLYDVSATFAFTDLNGTAVVPTEVRASLYDGEDQLVIDFGSLPFVLASGSKTIVVPGAFNTLAAGQLEDTRILRVELITAAGSVRRSFSYFIEGIFRLELMNNSFMSIEAANLLARSTPNIAGWSAATEEKRFAALIEAYNRLTRISMKFRPSSDDRILSGREELMYSDEVVITRNLWHGITANEYLTWPVSFRKILRTAQLTEANEMLEGDDISRRQRYGIISETIGESSMTMAQGRIDHGVSSLTMKVLAGHVFFNNRITRS